MSVRSKRVEREESGREEMETEGGREERKTHSSSSGAGLCGFMMRDSFSKVDLGSSKVKKR